MLNMLSADTLYPSSNPFHQREHQRYSLIYSRFSHLLAPILCIIKTNEIGTGVKRIAIESHHALAFL